MRKGVILGLIWLGLLAACVTEPAANELTVMTHDSFAVSEATLAAFEAAQGVRVTILPAGDTGAALNQAILAREAPLADLFYGVDNSFMTRALEADIFLPYAPEALAMVAPEFRLDPTNHLIPVNYGDVCLNYDKAWFEANELPLPASLAELADPRYAGLLVVENPATSSPGLAFLLATVEAFGETGDYTYLDYWAALRANDVLVTNGWEEAYYGHFSVAGDGARPLVVSYATSPPAEVIFADPPRADAPSASLVAPGMCFRQVEFVGILRGTSRLAQARAFVDFMLSDTFQADIPLNMFVYPVNAAVELPATFITYAQVPTEPARLAPAAIDAGREAWIEAWTTTVLR